MIKDKLLRLGQKFEEISNRPAVDAPQRKRLEVTKLALMPFGIWIHNLKSFFALSFLFALLMAALSFATKNSLICGLNEFAEISPFRCTAPANALYISFLLLRLLIIAVFLKSWYRIAIKHETVDIREILVINIQDWKLFGIILLLCAINLLPMVSVMILSARDPNPNWLIESAYFAVVSCGLWLPFVAIRFYCIPAFVADNAKLPSLLQVLKLTADNGLKFLFSFSMLLIFCALLMLYVLRLCEFLIPQNPMMFGILSEILYDMSLLSIMALLMNYCAVQKLELFNEQNESDGK